jgi:hypothetical protein
MSLIKIDWNPPDRQLRQFGFCALAALPVIGWMLTGWRGPAAWSPGNATLFACLTGAGIVCALLAAIRPTALKPVFLTATVITLPIGFVVSEVMLAAIYFLVFTPVALFFRLIRRDALERRFEPAATTYWTPKAQHADTRPLSLLRCVMSQKNSFQQAGQERRSSLIGEVLWLLKTNKKWWLLPILIVLALLAALCFLGGTGVAPFIYPMF